MLRHLLMDEHHGEEPTVEPLDEVTQPIFRRCVSLVGRRAILVLRAENERARISDGLRMVGFAVEHAAGRTELIAALRDASSRGDGFSVVLIDPSAPGMAIFDLIAEIARHPGLIVVAAEMDRRVLTRARRVGAALIRRPFHDDDLGDLAVDRVLEQDRPTLPDLR